MNKIIGYFIAGILAICFVAIILLYAAFSWGFIIYKFWYWFIIPVFTGLPKITITQAVGLYLFTTFFKNQTVTSVKKEYKDTTGDWIIYFSPWITLIIGYLIKIFFF